MKDVTEIGSGMRSLAKLMAVGMILLPTAASSVQPQRNDEFGIEATFPEGGRVCITRSGSHPLGFFAWYGGRPTDCNTTRGDQRASVLAVYAYYNSAFEGPARRLLSEECSTPAARWRGEIDLRGLSFRGFASAACAFRKPDGSIHVEVVAQGGQSYADRRIYPRINYTAALITRVDRRARDMAMFRRFLSDIRIAPPR
jgi:hypothetical protein